MFFFIILGFKVKNGCKDTKKSDIKAIYFFFRSPATLSRSPSIGIFYAMSEKGGVLTPEWRLFLTVGFCIGFTTFSTFSGENMALLRDRIFFCFAVYRGLSVLVGLLFTWLGYMAITRLTG